MEFTYKVLCSLIGSAFWKVSLVFVLFTFSLSPRLYNSADGVPMPLPPLMPMPKPYYHYHFSDNSEKMVTKETRDLATQNGVDFVTKELTNVPGTSRTASMTMKTTTTTTSTSSPAMSESQTTEASTTTTTSMKTTTIKASTLISTIQSTTSEATPPAPPTPPKPPIIPGFSTSPTPDKPPMPPTPATPPTQPTPAVFPTSTSSSAKTSSTTQLSSTTSSSVTASPSQRFCNKTKSYTTSTRCSHCRSWSSQCEDGSVQVSRDYCTHGIVPFAYPPPYEKDPWHLLDYEKDPWHLPDYMRGWLRYPSCVSRCRHDYTVAACCQGFWGDNCDECPGGNQNPCSGHGECSVNDGTCECQEGFTGTACEICEDKNKFGKNCSQDCTCVNGQCDNGLFGSGSCVCESGYKGVNCDIEIPDCKDFVCHGKNWKCALVDGKATCVCATGYEFDKFDCEETNPCEGPTSLCRSHSRCEHTGPGQHRCVCIDDYEGDGTVCTPIDPCQTNKGDCENTTNCLYVAPNQHKCVCKVGYEIYTPGIGCSLVDVCDSQSCDQNALCETIEPSKTSCTCKDGYVGNGTVCYGNILERLKDLHKNEQKLKGTLQLAVNLITKFYEEPLTKHGPFTIFVPNDRAFREEIKANKGFANFIDDEDRILQILRQHILIGQLKLEDLQAFDKFYTLQGNAALLQIRAKKTWNVFKYKLTGANTKAKVVGRNFFASNGMIHVVNDLLTMQPMVVGDTRKSAMDLINLESRYVTLEALIKAVGLEDVFDQENITVFAPENSAWLDLPTGTLDYLTQKQHGKEKLRVILKNHVFPGVIGVTHLINMPFIKSEANVQVNVSVTKFGQIRLDGKANVSQVNIPCSNGIYHHIDGILIPDYMEPIIPSICSDIVEKKVKGACGSCEERPCPQDTDKPTTELKTCSFWNNSGGRLRRMRGCSRTCLREIGVRKCCPGFYGSDCIPCPGGFQNPCNGRGKCQDSISGTGLCTCDRLFMGTACEKCREKDVFGPHCNQTCTCLHGQCDEGPKGKGTCKWGSCESGFVGTDCNMKLLKCGGDRTLCHASAECYVNQDNLASCRCQLGYEGDGYDCVEIDPCVWEANGGCHSQATCTKIGPGVRRCQCNTGWFGDGFYCQPKTPCRDQTDCHPNADCYDSGPGEYNCVCNVGYRGNGKECELSNLCLENNGGCHPKAICTPLKTGERNCTCPDNMAGDGLQCYGTIAEQVRSHPNLTALARMMEVVSPTNNVLESEEEELTFFAPSDDAMETFMTSFAQWNRSSYLTEQENVIWFLNFHTLYTDYTTKDMLMLDGVYRKYPTLKDGFSLHIVKVNQSLQIFVNHSDFASFVVSDISTLNGYIHIIDKVLEPFFPDDDDPTLEDALASRKDMSLFYEALQKANLLEELDKLDEYTVFVPTNDAMRTLNKSLTPEFLKYYIVTKLVFTPSVLDKDTEPTLLGPRHELLFTVSEDEIKVNFIKIVRSDILIDGGVIHQIDGILHPVMKRCDFISIKHVPGLCGDCTQPYNELACPKGYSPYKTPKVLKYNCTFVRTASTGLETIGCQQVCVLNTTKPECCGGYYSPVCLECPGGAENPCSGHGRCDDGMAGDGTCQCDPGFLPPDCSACVNSSMAPPTCNVSYESCGYRNGNCSEHAVCTQTTSGVSCRCPLGYVGDGYTCTSLCDTLNNGGCHAQAVCVFDASTHAVNCTCKSGYHGNGTWCKENFDPCVKDNGGCDKDRAQCTSMPPKVTDLVQDKPGCDCLDGFVGNGTLCVTNLMDAVSRIPALNYFYNWLHDKVTKDSADTTLDDRWVKSTLFAPVSNDWQDLNVSDIVVVGTSIRLSPHEPHSGVTNDSDVHSPLLLVSQSGQKINIAYNDEKQQYMANGIPIVDENIETLNGILHLTAFPVVNYVQVAASTDSGDSDNTVVIVSVVIVIVVLAGLVIALILYRRSHEGFFNIFKRFQIQGSESTLSFARLSAQEEDDDFFKGSDSAKYDNPVFNDPDLM